MIGIVIGILVVVVLIFLFNGYQNKWQSFHGSLFNIIVIGLLLFLFFSALYVYDNKNVEIKNVQDFVGFGKIYLNWFANFFGNVKGIAGYAVKQDWEGNSTIK